MKQDRIPYMFHLAGEELIRDGRVTDVYFARTLEVLRARGIAPQVSMEVRARTLPDGWPWAVLAGIEEVARLFEGRRVTVEAAPEGSIFGPGEPVLLVSGVYPEFAIFETALLGFLCQASGIATRAARTKKAAGIRKVLSFGARRMHPAIAPMIDRAALIGGCDTVSVVESALRLGEAPQGTMPHALVLLLGDTVEAARAFDELMPPEVRRVVLIDTFADEKFEALRVAEAFGREREVWLRFDTPPSRRGDLKAILAETRFELDYRGFRNVRFMCSGGIDEHAIRALNPFCDAYGVGGYVANAPAIDFSLDIVEVEGRPLAKRGKEAGAKRLFACAGCGARLVAPRFEPETRPCPCGAEMRDLIRPLVRSGEVVARLGPAREIRDEVLRRLAAIS